MERIYTFLQKRKMHENHHGIIMIVIAYVLSFLMLFFGSDTFYNITSKAERIQIKTNEETHVTNNSKRLAMPMIEMKNNILQSELINTNGMKGISNTKITMNITANKVSKKTKEVEKTETVNKPQGDTVWLLGHSMDSSEYDTLLMQMDDFDSISGKSDDSTDLKRGTIKEYSEIKKGSAVAKGITKDEIVMLQRIVEAEATGEDMIGRILIANVIFNRMMSGHFPDTVKGVIFQRSDTGYQFSPISDHRFWSVCISNKTKEAVSRALAGEDYSDGALYFMSRKNTNSSNARWFDNHLNWLFKHGGHEFFK